VPLPDKPGVAPGGQIVREGGVHYNGGAVGDELRKGARMARHLFASWGDRPMLLLVATLGIAFPSMAQERLRVHEWGTFTALQDEAGVALAGINVDDEPVPDFVHNLKPYLFVRPHALAERQRWILMQGAPQGHPHVTMRLETPVLYFYPPPTRSRARWS
jgi:hypothetical protein